MSVMQTHMILVRRLCLTLPACSWDAGGHVLRLREPDVLVAVAVVVGGGRDDGCCGLDLSPTSPRRGRSVRRTRQPRTQTPQGSGPSAQRQAQQQPPPVPGTASCSPRCRPPSAAACRAPSKACTPSWRLCLVRTSCWCQCCSASTCNLLLTPGHGVCVVVPVLHNHAHRSSRISAIRVLLLRGRSASIDMVE